MLALQMSRTIDGTVAGTSEPITMDMNVERFQCAKRRTFALAFCPDRETIQQTLFSKNKTSSPCQEGITFCYVPILSEKFAKEEFALPTHEDLDVSKKCGKLFRGFKVALRFMLTERYEKRLFYEIQLSYIRESYYFEMPDNMCIKILLGNTVNLLTTVSTMDGDILEPVQVRLSKTKWKMLGVSKEEYRQSWLDTTNMKRLRSRPSLKMLFMDLKSFELESQMIFTVGSKYQCKMYARLQNTMIGQKCYSQFRQKLTALRPYGKNSTTTYKLSIESGVFTNDTTGSKSILTKILDQEYEETKATEEQQSDMFEGIQSQSENVEKLSEEQLEHQVLRDEKKVEDTTPWYKKLGAFVVNTAATIGCNAIKLADSGCSANLEFRDSKTSTFHESYTKSQIKNRKSKNSFASFHSVQKTLQTVFTHSQGKTETTSHTEERSMSNAVTKRNIIQIAIQVPEGKILTPMQMSVDCEGNSVKIPWLKFRLTDERRGIVQEYDLDEKFEVKEKVDDYVEDENEILKEISEQERTISKAFVPKPLAPIPIPTPQTQSKSKPQNPPAASIDDGADVADEYLNQIRDNSYNY